MTWPRRMQRRRRPNEPMITIARVINESDMAVSMILWYECGIETDTISGMFLMTGTIRSLPTIEVVAERSATAEPASRRRSQVTEVLWLPTQHIDQQELRLQRRARRQALALMVASSLFTLLVLYAAWTMLHGAAGTLS
jgi:hypothetical protein